MKGTENFNAISLFKRTVKDVQIILHGAKKKAAASSPDKDPEMIFDASENARK